MSEDLQLLVAVDVAKNRGQVSVGPVVELRPEVFSPFRATFTSRQKTSEPKVIPTISTAPSPSRSATLGESSPASPSTFQKSVPSSRKA